MLNRAGAARRIPADSVIGRALRWLLAVPPDSHAAPRLPPLTFDMLEAAVQGSRLVAFGRRMVFALWHGIEHSRAAAAVGSASRTWVSTSSADKVALLAWTIGVAALTTLFMLVVVERYPFPRRTALLLPMLAVVLALLAWRWRAPIAHALEDRRAS
jgi:hypothetical protein